MLYSVSMGSDNVLKGLKKPFTAKMMGYEKPHIVTITSLGPKDGKEMVRSRRQSCQRAGFQ